MIDFAFINIEEEKTCIAGIPVIVLNPKNPEHDIETIVLYHGWSSNKETQRMRGFILSSAGYRVIIPDAANHGQRDALSDYGFDKGDVLWTTVLNSIDEWTSFIDGLVETYGIDVGKIGLIGNSMGGITAGGIYTQNKDIKALVVLNGSMAWENTNNLIKDHINISMTEKLRGIEERVNMLDPIKNTNLLVERPILLLHGECDSTLSIESVKLFYGHISPKYRDKEKINLIEYPGLNHIVSTNMMEESILFFHKHLKERRI